MGCKRIVIIGGVAAGTKAAAKARRAVAFCKTSLRAYEAYIILEHRGYGNVWVLDGGLAAWPFEKQIINK